MREESPYGLGEDTFRDVPIITLLSDFGERDPYVGSMKGVILSICRKARIIDITHDVAKFNIVEGGFILAAITRYFPVGTIHVAIVDPGVGTSRRGLLVRTKRSYLVGPDNGILWLAADKEGVEEVNEIRNPKYMLPEVSSTFHGRDVFCPVAAHLANGISMNEFGPETHDFMKLQFSRPTKNKGTVSGEVIHIDGFGNIVSNIMLKDIVELGIKLGSTVTVTVGSVVKKAKFCKSYGEVSEGEPLVLIGSTGFLEISINGRNAALEFKARERIRVSISQNQ
jgi:S-adenosylmethionine hydrolase